ncbi:hypothetical protein ACWGJP_04795 [Microbacterium sp. NPDC055903]
MRTIFSLFPWDVEGDPDAPRWLAERGVTDVALAATYHAARAATPRHPRHRVVDVETSSSYLADSSFLPPGHASFERARDRLVDEGIAVHAWVVLAHLDGARADIPRVVDAFGTPLRHALCLRSPQARGYVDATIDAVARTGAASWIVEGASWAGLGHASLHDKIAAGGLDIEALSWCFCARCSAAAGVDAAEVRGALTSGEPLDPRTANGIRAARRAAADELRRHVLESADRHGVTSILFHPDPEATEAPRGATLADAWGGPDRAIAELRAGRAQGAYVTILDDPRPDAEALRGAWSALRDAGAQDLLIYHAGLASTPRLDAALAARKGLS